jgi:dTMP kinase
VFVTLEGLDGVGKTTQAALLASRLRADGHEVVECREPGGTALGERVRALLLDRDGAAVSPRAEALLFAAARAQLVTEVIGPARERGAWVVCDRFLDSSVAYQGAGRGLGASAVRDVSLFATGGLVPDRTLLLVGEQRHAAGDRDRIEAEDGDFHAAVEAGFRVLADAEPGRVVLVDGSGDVEAVHARIWAALGA